jgi:hypothetical protein
MRLRPANNVCLQLTMDSQITNLPGISPADLELLRTGRSWTADHGRCEPRRHPALHPAGRQPGACRLSRHSQLDLFTLSQRRHGPHSVGAENSRCCSRRCAAAAAGGASAKCSATARPVIQDVFPIHNAGRQGDRRHGGRDQHDRPRAAAAAQPPFPPGGGLDARDVHPRRVGERCDVCPASRSTTASTWSMPGPHNPLHERHRRQPFPQHRHHPEVREPTAGGARAADDESGSWNRSLRRTPVRKRVDEADDGRIWVRIGRFPLPHAP